MAYKGIGIMDILEIIRRWHNRQKISHIATILDYDRKTVRNYINLAKRKGISLDKPLPGKTEFIWLMKDEITQVRRLARAQDLLKPHLQELKDLISDKYNPLKPKIAFEVICEKYHLTGKVSYTTFKRFVKANKLSIRPPTVTCRIEVDPGEEIQLDYATVGSLRDSETGKRKKVFAFIGPLSHSRHKFVEFTFKQDQQSFIGSHAKMFQYFGGVPKRLLLDNLKAGVIKPDLYDPQINRTYRELSEYYGCFLDPCRVSKPQDKGKVERDVQTIRQQFRKFLALDPNLTLEKANELIKKWCIHEYGQKEHGSTQLKPYQVFIEKEQPQLRKLPEQPFEISKWKEAKVHPDCYIQYNKKTFTVPDRFVGKTVWIRATHKILQVYHQENLIKQHVITKNTRHMDLKDFPENMQAVLDKGMPLFLQKKARIIGPHFGQIIRNLLKIHAFMNMRKAQGLLSLVKKYDPELIEKTAKYILELNPNACETPKSFQQHLERLNNPTEKPPSIQQSMDFVRDINYFIHLTPKKENHNG